MFRSVVARQPPPSFTLKLVQANITRTGRRVEFHVTDQTFVTITESSAHTDFLATAAHQKWGSDHAIVTKDGLKLIIHLLHKVTIRFYYCGSLFNLYRSSI